MQFQQPYQMMTYPGGDEGSIPFFPWFGQYPPQMWDPSMWWGQPPAETWPENEDKRDLNPNWQQTGKQTCGDLVAEMLR